MDRETAINHAWEQLVPWHARQEEFKDIIVNPGDKFPPTADLMPDGVSWRITLVHRHFTKGNSNQEIRYFTYEINDDPEKATCKCGK